MWENITVYIKGMVSNQSGKESYIKLCYSNWIATWETKIKQNFFYILVPKYIQQVKI